MARLKRTVLCAVLVCASGATWPIDLAQSFQEALEQDASIRAARATADAGREALPQARAQLLPSVSATVSANNNRLTATAPNFQGFSTSNSYNYPSHGESLTVRQPIYRKYLIENYKQAQVVVEDVEATLANEMQNLAVKVAGAYFDALLAEEQYRLLKAQRLSYTTQLEGAQKQFKAGSGTRTDIDEVQARLDMTVAEELAAKQHIQFTRRQLQVFVNKPIESLAPVDASKLVLKMPEPNSLDYWTERAEESNPEIRALRARVDAASFDIEKAKSGHLPTLDAVAQWSRSASENTLNTQSSNDQQSIGFQLNIPIYSGGGVNSSVRQTLATKERAQQVLEAMRRDLGVRVQREFRGVTEGVLRIKALEQSVRSTEQLVQSSQKSFQAGSRTRLDILNAENNKMISLRDLMQARHAYILSSLRLYALVNEADSKTIDGINQILKH